jgi:starch synthase
MDILMACSELAPVARVGGGLGEVVAALGKTLCQFDHKVTVALPRYACVDRAGLMLARRLTPLRLAVGSETVEATLFDGRLGSGVELLLVDVPRAYDRRGIYGEEGRDYPDNARRFGLFCRVLAQLVAKRKQEGRPFDVVHAHDWAAALLPFLLRGKGTRTVLTVHDVGAQGQFPKQAVAEIGLEWDDFHPAGLEFFDQLNMLKAGVLGADVVTTVSPTHAREIQTPAEGAGLDGVFRARTAELVGIVNGIDYSMWSPATDPHLAARFDAEDATNKSRCKATLVHELELGLDPSIPLAVAVGPLSLGAGSDLLAGAVPAFGRAGAQLVIAGEGERALADRLERLAADNPAEVRFLGGPSEPNLHRLMAAADLVLLPARTEPCGVVQQYAQRYGALPVARAVGGLRDTIVDCDAHGETGTGFLFEEPTVDAMVGAVQRAISVMRTSRWPALRRRVMRLDLSWERSARRYAKLYLPKT